MPKNKYQIDSFVLIKDCPCDAYTRAVCQVRDAHIARGVWRYFLEPFIPKLPPIWLRETRLVKLEDQGLIDNIQAHAHAQWDD